MDAHQEVTQNKANVHFENGTPLCVACQNGHLDVAKLLIQYNADIHTDNEYCLRASALNGHKKMVEFLLDCGALISIDNNQPLRNAVKADKIDIVEMLLDRGAYIDAGDILSWAYVKGNIEIINFLYSRLCKEKVSEIVTVESDDPSVVKIALDKQDTVEDFRSKIFETACAKEKLKIMNFYLETFNCTNSALEAGLQKAHKMEKYGAVLFLMKKGAKYDDKKINWKDCVKHIVERKDKDNINFLIQKGQYKLVLEQAIDFKYKDIIKFIEKTEETQKSTKCIVM
jgi:ankyrin repeat protein